MDLVDRNGEFWIVGLDRFGSPCEIRDFHDFHSATTDAADIC